MKTRAFVALTVIAMVAAACTSGGGGPSPTKSPSGSQSPTTGIIVMPGGLVRFAVLADVPLLSSGLTYRGSETPHSLDKVSINDKLAAYLSDPKTRAKLA